MDDLQAMCEDERREEQGTMRATSLEAYRKLRDSGALSKMRWTVYDHLWHHGPLTRSELDSALKGPQEVNPSYHKRLSELERMGVVRTVGERECRMTGQRCVEWDVTDLDTPMPLEKIKPKPKSARDEELLSIASEAVLRLEQAAMDNGDMFARSDARQLKLRLLDWRAKNPPD